MTYGLSLKWRYPFQEKIEVRKPAFQTVFTTLCVAVIFIILISFSYYSLTPVRDVSTDIRENGRQILESRSIPVYHDFAVNKTNQYKVVDIASKLIADHIVLNQDSDKDVSDNTRNHKQAIEELVDLDERRTVENKNEANSVSVNENINLKIVDDSIDIDGDELIEIVTSKVEIEELRHNGGGGQKTEDGSILGKNGGAAQRSEVGSGLGENGGGEQRAEDGSVLGKNVGARQKTEDGSRLGKGGAAQRAKIGLGQENNSGAEQRAEDGSGLEVGNVDVSKITTRVEIDWNDKRLDILHMPKKVFDERYKNPCWEEHLESPNPYLNNEYINFSPSAKRTLTALKQRWESVYDVHANPTRLRCLPYFLIIGQPKCGSTDLFWKIATHPDIDAPPIKELHWWSRSRQGRRFSYSKIIPFDDYLDMFDQGATRIQDRVYNMSHIDDSSDMELQEQIVLGEASVSLFWDNNEWNRFPENKGRSEPKYIVPDYIHHFIPDVKLILIIREPVERMYSDYLYFHSENKSADDFHNAVRQAVVLYTNCSKVHGDRHCVYNNILANKVRVRLRVGMYSIYLKDWLRLFPRNQFHVVRLEDYSRNPIVHVKQIYKFLDMRELSDEEEETVMESHVSNVRKEADKKLGGMHKKTRRLLNEFYDKYNTELAEMLDDTKFLWRDII